MSTATETATIHMAATKRIEKKMLEDARDIEKSFWGGLFGLNPINKDYEDAKDLIREVCEEY